VPLLLKREENIPVVVAVVLLDEDGADVGGGGSGVDAAGGGRGSEYGGGGAMGVGKWVLVLEELPGM